MIIPLQTASPAEVDGDLPFEGAAQAEDSAAEPGVGIDSGEVAEPPRKRRSRRNAQRPEEAAPRTELAGLEGVNADAAPYGR